MTALTLLTILLILSGASAGLSTSVTVLSPPIIKSMEIMPQNPDLTQDLICSADVIRVFNETTHYSWLKNNEPTEFDSAVPKHALKNKDQWTCLATVTNDYGTAHANATVKVIDNTPITAQIVQEPPTVGIFDKFFSWILSIFKI
jgi:hypothetical protein